MGRLDVQIESRKSILVGQITDTLKSESIVNSRPKFESLEFRKDLRKNVEMVLGCVQ